jgi:xanthine dehydrogenase large subunit
MDAPGPATPPPPASGAGAPVAHDSAHLHVTGEAAYTDDVAEPIGTLHAAIGRSPVAHGRLRGVDLAAVRAAPGVVAVITAADVPGVNDVGPIQHDDPILADGVVHFAGQPVFAVAATGVEAARRAALLARYDIEPLPAVLTIEQALAAESYVLPPAHLVRGDPVAALAGAPRRLKGTCRSGGQDHFYLEGQIALAIPQEDAAMRVLCSTQHPGEVQLMVARALGLAAHDVVVECRRMGGAFGGKETQMSLFACVAAILARATGRAVKLRLDRDDDMVMTGKRHAFRYDWDVGFDDDGRIRGLDLAFASRCGFSADLSGPINDRALFHADNCYWLPHVALHSYRCRTNTVSDTAFRGFGGPQGMFAIEMVLDEIARALGKDPLDVRRVNLYGIGERDVAPYGMVVEDNVAPEIVDRLAATSRYRERRQAIAGWNRGSPVLKRGIALTPVKFGISFTATHYNQAGALLHLYRDGTLLLNHGGTEMGQGLFTKVRQVVAHELGIPGARIRVSASDTAKVPNASPTAASSGSDLNGMAARDAARKIKAALAAFAAARLGGRADEVVFADDAVAVAGRSVPFAELARMAYFARVPLSATGFYATPKIHYDRATLTGRPFFYFAYGAAVSEVVVDVLTGETRLLAVDILHDAGSSLNPALDRGQVEGGFLQGYGWLTMEALGWSERGELTTHSPSTYKIPTARDWPPAFRIDFHDVPNREDTIHRSKAVGEPPFMLALSAFHAIRDAVASVVPKAGALRLDAPATAEAVFRAVRAAAPHAEGELAAGWWELPGGDAGMPPPTQARVGSADPSP